MRLATPPPPRVSIESTYNFIFFLYLLTLYYLEFSIKVSKGAKIRNRYNQVPHLTKDTNGKVTTSQLDTTNESQEVSPFPVGDHKVHINRRPQRHSKRKTEKSIKDPQKKNRHGTVRKKFTEGLKPARQPHVDQDTYLKHRTCQ